MPSLNNKTPLLLLALLPLGVASAPPAVAQVKTASPIAWMVFVDDLHLDFRHTGRLRTFLRSTMNKLLQNGDRIALSTSGPSAVFTAFGSEPEFRSQVSNFSGNGLKPDDLLAGGRAAEREMRYRVQASLSAAITAVVVLGQFENPRRALLYVSNGYALDLGATPRGRALAQLARANGVAIFTIDGRIFDDSSSVALNTTPGWDDYVTAEQTSLKVIAEQSGGLAITSPTDLPAALARIRSTVR
jgi:hypothetical protein